jgi:hypothetical protein
MTTYVDQFAYLNTAGQTGSRILSSTGTVVCSLSCNGQVVEFYVVVFPKPVLGAVWGSWGVGVHLVIFRGYIYQLPIIIFKIIIILSAAARVLDAPLARNITTYVKQFL